MSACPFCVRIAEMRLPTARRVARIADAFPVSLGHTLVVPVRHEAGLSALHGPELAVVWSEVRAVQRDLVARHAPDGFNIGVNDGVAAGQTVPHVHVHVIPRYRGDVADPRGGIRWVIPDRADYWSKDAGE